METKLKDKLLKLYELSKRGIDGEKDNAEAMLIKFLERHGLTIDDIVSDLPKQRYYRFKNQLNRKIIAQVAFKVLGSTDVFVNRCKEVTVTVTDYQHVQILEMLDFHLTNFNEEREQFLKDFTDAYVQKHRLFREKSDDDDEPRKPLTSEERASLFKMEALMGVMNNKSYVKKIG